MAEKGGAVNFQIILERPRSGPNVNLWVARLGGRKEPFVGKTPLSATSLCCQSIAAIMAERDESTSSTTSSTKDSVGRTKPKAKAKTGQRKTAGAASN